MGSVYLGHDLLLDRPVAVKFITDILPTAQARQRFRIEAVALARLQHPNVMGVYRAGQVAGRPYIVGELVNGQSLEQLEKPLAWQRALDIALGLARGLAAAHHRGVLHRDLKPSNAILAADGQVKLVDFGIAKLVGEGAPLSLADNLPPGEVGTVEESGETVPSGAGRSAGNATMSMSVGATDSGQAGGAVALPALTQAGTRIGTPLYMAPEVWLGQPASACSDLYSLGVILYELCSGHPPHQAETALALSWRVTTQDSVPLGDAAPSVDSRLAIVVDRCLRRDPIARYSSASELCADLEKLRRRLAIRRRIAGAAVSGLGVILALSIAGNALVNWARTRQAVAAQLREAQAALYPARECNVRVEELRGKAFAAFDHQQVTTAERLWAQSLQTARSCYVSYQQATRHLDGALLLDPQKNNVRSQFAEVLYEQAVLLDRDHRDAQRDEVLARLASYASQEQPEYLKRWNQPGLISFTTTPSAARIEASRYVADLDGHLSLQSIGHLGSTPLAINKLQPGSYLFVVSAPGRDPVRAPLLVGRGERINLHIDVPAPSEIPPGFVYVPAGRTLFGATDDERVRATILKTVPMHQVTTGPYLIARVETTFGDWLAFLNALPQALRERYRPHCRAATAQEELDLRQTSAGTWTLAMSPLTHQRHIAALGEPIRYPHRDRRKTVDWQQLPVVCIDITQVQAYIRWLREAGQVAAARLCTEHEWERAARGADDRDYPSGNFLQPDDANIDITYEQEPLSMGPDPVGSHPASRSPFGIDDLSGNVWEIVTSSLSRNRLVLRGGAFYFDIVTARATNRQPVENSIHDQRIGLRLCADLPGGRR